MYSIVCIVCISYDGAYWFSSLRSNRFPARAPSMVMTSTFCKTGCGRPSRASTMPTPASHYGAPYCSRPPHRTTRSSLLSVYGTARSRTTPTIAASTATPSRFRLGGERTTSMSGRCLRSTERARTSPGWAILMAAISRDALRWGWRTQRNAVDTQGGFAAKSSVD